MIYFIYGMIVGSIIALTLYQIIKWYKNDKQEIIRQRTLYNNFISLKENDPNVNIYPKATDPQEGLQVLHDILLGEDWIVNDPLPTLQVNTYIVSAIAKKYMKGWWTI